MTKNLINFNLNTTLLFVIHSSLTGGGGEKLNSSLSSVLL